MSITVALLGLLVVIVLKMGSRQSSIDEVTRARVALKLLKIVAEEFEAVTGAPSRAEDLPSFYRQTRSIQGLQSVWARLVQPDGRPAVDPWNVAIRLIPTSKGPMFESAGPDQQWGDATAPKQTPAFKASVDNLRSDDEDSAGSSLTR